MPEDSRKKLEHYSERSAERAMEQAIYADCGPTGSFHESPIWGRLIAFQVPLFDNIARDGWGHIDLLGLDATGNPVVIELKRAQSRETPLRCLMEGVANAIAVQENWGAIRSEVAAIASRRHPDQRVADVAETVKTVVLAPTEYWDSWAPFGNPGKAVPRSTRESFWRVCDASASSGFPIILAALEWPLQNATVARIARTSFARSGVVSDDHRAS